MGGKGGMTRGQGAEDLPPPGQQTGGAERPVVVAVVEEEAAAEAAGDKSVECGSEATGWMIGG